ncbi:MAG: LuxR C-terminal-related transcriptional regulator, partial [Ilumatobacteraceae bacterium]
LRHAAHAAEGHDGSLAARLSAHAADLAARGAGEQAAEFAVFAANLSPVDDPAHHERHIEAARLAFQRGEADLASQMLSRVDDIDAPPSGKVRELLVRATVQFSLGSADQARRHALEALGHCTTDGERVEVHSILARVSYDNFDESTRQATIAMELAERCEVPPLVLASVLAARAGEAFMAGHGLDREMFERAIALERDTVQFSANSAYSSFAVLLKIADELDESRAMLLSVLAHNDDDGALPFVLSHLPQLELWTGNWDAAEEYAQQHLDAALRTGQHDQAVQARSNLALIDIYRGEVTTAAVLAEDIRCAGREGSDAWTERSGLGLLGQIAMAEGDAERAVTIFHRWRDLADQMALRDPGYKRMEGDLIEALLATGRLAEAAANATAMQQTADRLARPTALAGAARARALVAAANGDRPTAVTLAQAAVDGYAATPMVVEHARSLLTLGQIHRRFKEKAPARAALEQALVVFDRLGAERLAERTRQDLARIGLRTSGGTALTETELRVARLAATGRTVRQVGDELFISPKTVEANLTRVYRKLGISGRAELATWAATVDGRAD